MVEEERSTRLADQDAELIRRRLELEDALAQLYPPALSYEELPDNVATGRIGTRVEQPPRRNIQDIAGVKVDEQGSLGLGTPRPPLRIGRRRQPPTT